MPEGVTLKWYEIPIAGIVPEPGNTARRKVGNWRTFRPVINQDKCTRCYICWMYCPDGAIMLLKKPFVSSKGVKYDVTFEVDYDHCKGCRICANECPVKAIDVVREYE